MKHDLIIARYGELALKSDGVRKRFENRLANNIRASIDAEVKVRQARIYISPKDFNDAIEKLERIFGIVSFSPAVTTKSTFEDIERDVSKYAEKLHEEGLLDEVSALKNKGYTKDMVSMQGLGYKEILDFLNASLYASIAGANFPSPSSTITKASFTPPFVAMPNSASNASVCS